MYFRKEDVMRYIRARDLKLSPETRTLGHSFRSLQDEDMWKIRRDYPADYARIERWFPFVGAGVRRFELKMVEEGYGGR